MRPDLGRALVETIVAVRKEIDDLSRLHREILQRLTKLEAMQVLPEAMRRDQEQRFPSPLGNRWFPTPPLVREIAKCVSLSDFLSVPKDTARLRVGVDQPNQTGGPAVVRVLFLDDNDFMIGQEEHRGNKSPA